MPRESGIKYRSRDAVGILFGRGAGRPVLGLSLLVVVLAMTTCTRSQRTQESQRLKVSSSAFTPGSPVPRKYANKGEGDNVSPPITWSGAPTDAGGFAVTCVDTDAPTIVTPIDMLIYPVLFLFTGNDRYRFRIVTQPSVHWVVYEIPGNVASLPDGSVGEAKQGMNDFGASGWGGPFPPKGGGTHHYHFNVYALETSIHAPAGLTKEQLLEAIKGQVVAQGELVGTYERR